ncbi:MAG: ankyrin repeat domain-containing protein [Proteobacteria bacterium]|nr:ankyrin repeat domain-containing protein [Pseudomonadota bacterium]
MSAEDLIGALCARGWDAPVTVDLDRARKLLGAAAESVFAAATAGDVEALRAQLDADPEAVSRSGGPRDWPPILYAAYSRADEMEGTDILGVTRLLLDRGADPNAGYAGEGSDNPFSALYGTIAVSEDRERMKLLLAAGAHPSDGNSTFHAVESFDLELLQALADAGIDKDDASYTLKHAFDMRWPAAIRLLLDAGADPNAVHPAAGETTLHWAIKRGAPADQLTSLFDAGADPNLRTNEGKAGFLAIRGFTPLDFALRLGHVEAVDLLRTKGAVASEPTPAEAFVFAVARGDEADARGRLTAHPSLLDDLTDEDRGLVAHWTQHGRHEAVALACALGFPVDSVAWMGLTALHWAALRGDVRLVETLLAAGAEAVDLGGYFGTPHHTADTCPWYDGDYSAVLRLLA